MMNVSRQNSWSIYPITICVFILLHVNIMTAEENGVLFIQNEPSFNVPSGQRQLFLDDYGIASLENLTRKMHQPDKKGAVIRPDPTDLQLRSLQIRTAPVWDKERNVWKLWDISNPDDMAEKEIYCSGYYESKDGLHWTKPDVDLVEYHGSRKNNFVFFLDGEKYSRIPCVVYDPADPDSTRRFKAAAPPNSFAVSPDGIHWKKLDVPGVKSQDEYNLSFDERDHLFILTVKLTGPYGRSVFLSTSRDFENWTKPEPIFHADELDQKLGRENIKARFANSGLAQPFFNDSTRYNVDVYNMGVFKYEGYYIGTPALYHATGPIPNYPNTEGFHLIQLVCSRDLKTWKRLGDRKTFIGPSPLGAGAYDLTQIIGPSTAVVRGDQLWFYYTGLKYRTSWKYVGKYPNGKYVPLPGLDEDTGAICLAVLRRDGFISLDAGEKEGKLITKPFVFSGNALYINADVSHGWLKVEMMNKSGQSVAESELLQGDLLHEQVKWKSVKLDEIKNQVVSLKFTVNNASFYSYWFDK